MPRRPPPETPLYVKLPQAAGEELDRASAALGLPKKDIVAGLVTRYLDPDSERGRSTLDALSSRRPLTTDGDTMIGSYSFQPYNPPEIMNAEQAAQFLQIDERSVIELAEAGKIPGKKLGPAWRFSRDALITWLATPEPAKR